MVEFKTKYQGPQIDMEGKCFSKPTSIRHRRSLVKKCSMRYSMIVLAGGKREFQSYCLSIPLTHDNKSTEGEASTHMLIPQEIGLKIHQPLLTLFLTGFQYT